MPAQISGATATVAALVLAVALVPATLTAQNDSSQLCTDPDTYDVSDTIRASTPLSERVSASHLVKITEEELTGDLQAPEDPNGIDAYIHDFDCVVVNRYLVLEASAGNLVPEAEADMAVKFYNDMNQLQGEISQEDEDGVLRGDVPEGTHYMVIVLEDGPLISGIDYDKTPAEPYSVVFEATLHA